MSAGDNSLGQQHPTTSTAILTDSDRFRVTERFEQRDRERAWQGGPVIEQPSGKPSQRMAVIFRHPTIRQKHLGVRAQDGPHLAIQGWRKRASGADRILELREDPVPLQDFPPPHLGLGGWPGCDSVANPLEFGCGFHALLLTSYPPQVRPIDASTSTGIGSISVRIPSTMHRHNHSLADSASASGTSTTTSSWTTARRERSSGPAMRTRR